MADVSNFNPVTAFPTATIVSGQAASAEIDLHGGVLYGIYLPAEFDGTALTFTTAPAAGGGHVAVKDSSGSAISFTVAASGFYGLSADQVAKLKGCRFLKLVSGTNQSATDTVITLAIRPS
jgi:hypothetical protein